MHHVHFDIISSNFSHQAKKLALPPDEKIVIQRSKEACLETHSQQVVKLGFEPNLEMLKICAVLQMGVEKKRDGRWRKRNRTSECKRKRRLRWSWKRGEDTMGRRDGEGGREGRRKRH